MQQTSLYNEENHQCKIKINCTFPKLLSLVLDRLPCFGCITYTFVPLGDLALVVLPTSLYP